MSSVDNYRPITLSPVISLCDSKDKNKYFVIQKFIASNR